MKLNVCAAGNAGSARAPGDENKLQSATAEAADCWTCTVPIGPRFPPERHCAMQRFASTWPRHAVLWLTLLAAIAALGGCARDTINGSPVRPNADNRLGPMS